MPNLQWPDILIRDIARRRVIPVLGAGVSKHAKSPSAKQPPLWKDFLLDAAKSMPSQENTEHIYKAIADGDLLHACEWIKNRLDEHWIPYIRAQFISPKYLAGELHETIAMLDARIVFSLNFDEIYETKSREIYENSQYVKNYHDTDICEFLRGDERYIVKIHGNLASPSRMIFTQQEYSRARVANSAFYSAFDAALMTHTFLFIGCGYSDPDLNLLLENQSFNNIANDTPHYFLTSDEMSQDLQMSLRKNRNLKILRYDKVDDNHSGLILAMNDLLTKVNDYRDDLADTRNW